MFAADHLVACETEDPFGGEVHRLDDASFVNRDDAVDRGVDDRFEPDCRLANGLFGYFPLRDVAGDLGEAPELRVASRKSGASTPLAKNRLPSLRICQRSSVARPLAAALAISCSGTFMARSSPGKEHADLLPDDFRFRISEKLLGAGIPAHDSARRDRR